MKRVLVFLIVVLVAMPVYAGGRRTMRKFDEASFKELNNRLIKQEKLLKKMQKQLKTGGESTVVSGSTDDLVADVTLDGDVIGVPREDGRIEVWIQGDTDVPANITPDSYVHETQAKIAVPSSYFLDLRGTKLTNATRKYTADVLVLHDANGNTLTLTDVDETNNIGTAGPIAGGRDQSGAFTNSTWIYFFIIYNPVTGDVSSLASASATAPSLPTGYTFFVRVGSSYVNGAGWIVTESQINAKIYADGGYTNLEAGAANTYQSLDMAASIPPTAKTLYGYFGLSTAHAEAGMGVASSAAGINSFSAKLPVLTGSMAIYQIGSVVFFELPMLTAQTIWWKADTTDAVYALFSTAYEDDL